MPKVVEIEIEVGSKTALNSINDLRKAATTLEEQLSSATFGTAEFTRLSTQLKNVRNQFKDIDASLEGLDKEQRAAALVDTFNGLTGAVGAVSSAFIAFGADAGAIEDAEKKLLGIIGVVNGLRDVSNSLVAVNKLTGLSFEKLGTSIKASFASGTLAANTFKVALAGLGIGLVIAAVSKLVDVLGEEDAALETNKAAVEASTKAYDAFVAAVVAANDEIGRSADIAVAQAELEGKTAADITQIQQDALNEQLNNTATQLDLLTKKRAEARNKAVAIAISEDKSNLEFLDKKKKAEEAYDAETKKSKDALNKILYDGDVKSKLLDINLQKKTNDEKKKIQEAFKQNLVESQAALNESLRKLDEARATVGADAINTQYANDLARLKEARDKELAQENLSNEARKNIKKKFAADSQVLEINRNNAILGLTKENNQKLEAEQKTLYENQLNDVDAYYSRLLGNIENAASQIAISQGIETEKQFENINTFIAKALNETQSLLKKQNENVRDTLRKRINDTVTLLEEEQLKRQAILQKETDDAIKQYGIFSEQARAAQDAQLKDFQKFQDAKTAAITKGAAELQAVDDKSTQAQKDNTVALINFTQQSFSDLFSALRDLNSANAGATEEEQRKAFENDKNYATAEAVINTLLTITRIFGNAAANPTSILFPAQPYIEAGIAAATGFATVSKIRNATFGGATGGAGGTSGGSTGSVSGGGSNVLNPFSTQGGGTNVLPPRLAPPSGGSQGVKAGNEQQGIGNVPIVRAYVLSGDVTDAQTADARLQEKRKL